MDEKYTVTIPHEHGKYEDIEKWLKDNDIKSHDFLPDFIYKESTYIYTFTDKSEALRFKMAWGGL